MGVNDDIADGLVSHRIDLLRASEGIRRNIVHHLELVAAELAEDIREVDLGVQDRSVREMHRRRQLLLQVDETLQTRYRQAEERLSRELIELAQMEEQATIRPMNRAVGFDLVQSTMTPDQLEQIANKSVIRGSPASDWWSKQRKDLRQRFETQIRMGMTEGESNDQIIRRIRGKSTGKRRVVKVGDRKRTVRLHRGGIMDVSKREASALVRTATQNVANQVHQSVYSNNAEVLRGQQALVTLDQRTSYICMARSGAAWSMDGSPLPESSVGTPFPGPPPWHFNCRTVLTPIVKSWDELLGTRRARELGLREAPAGTRASMDGQLAAGVGYPQFLRGKSAKFQRDVLGATRYKMWKENKLSLSQLIDHSTGRPLSVAELRRRIEEGTME